MRSSPCRRWSPVLAALAAVGSLASAPPLQAGFSGTDVFIPASARAAGAPPSQFTSTLWITNLSSSISANARLKFYERDTSNTSPITVPVSIAPGETKKYENVVQTVFGLSGASGAIRIQSDIELLASSRTYNLPSGSDIRDANGLFFTGIPQSFAIGSGETSSLQGVSQGGAEDFRYNFGMVETAGSPVTVRISVRNPDGTLIGTKDYPVQAFEAKQFGVADAAPGISTANGRLDGSVIAGSGAVLLYGTGVANGSQDSIGFEMSFRNSLLSAGVTSLNTFTGPVTIAGGSGIAVSPADGNQIVISATGTGLTLPFSGSAPSQINSAVFAVSTPGTSLGSSAVTGSVISGAPGSGSAGVIGSNGGLGATGSGVYGQHSAGGNGVYGYAPSGKGVYGTSGSNYGVYGTSSTFGMRGQQGSATGWTLPSNQAGVWGDSSAGYGVFGTSDTGAGVTGVSSSKWGVQALGYSTGVAAAALGAVTTVPGGYAAYLNGSVQVTGSLSKGGGSFRIDHPLDPENRYLSHSFVESPDMMNIYNGVAVLDSKGEASVPLPPWFSALNRDFRYQLTCVGGYAPVFISREVENSSFQIAGGKPGLKVSWQVTGIRQDAWANANRIPVEEAKGAVERGHYLHPEAFGQPEEKGEDWARNPELMKEMKQRREALASERQ